MAESGYNRRDKYFSPLSAELICKKHRNQRDFYNLKSSQLSPLALSASVEYLCYGSMTVRNIFTLTARGSRAVTSDSDD